MAVTRAPLRERGLSQRVRAVPPSGIRRFFDILATMEDVISLGVGEPDFDRQTDRRVDGLRAVVEQVKRPDVDRAAGQIDAYFAPEPLG